jgi:hypothetical protein
MGSKRWRRNRRLKCNCDGYHFPHRKFSGTCQYRPDCVALRLLLAKRLGEDVLSTLADYHWDNPGVVGPPGGGDPPF